MVWQGHRASRVRLGILAESFEGGRVVAWGSPLLAPVPRVICSVRGSGQLRPSSLRPGSADPSEGPLSAGEQRVRGVDPSGY